MFLCQRLHEDSSLCPLVLLIFVLQAVAITSSHNFFYQLKDIGMRIVNQSCYHQNVFLCCLFGIRVIIIHFCRLRSSEPNSHSLITQSTAAIITTSAVYTCE